LRFSGIGDQKCSERVGELERRFQNARCSDQQSQRHESSVLVDEENGGGGHAEFLGKDGDRGFIDVRNVDDRGRRRAPISPNERKWAT
jgi:hypothetical protein